MEETFEKALQKIFITDEKTSEQVETNNQELTEDIDQNKTIDEQNNNLTSEKK